MKTTYWLRGLSIGEKEILEMMLMELEVQNWFAITYNFLLSEDVVVIIQ